MACPRVPSVLHMQVRADSDFTLPILKFSCTMPLCACVVSALHVQVRADSDFESDSSSDSDSDGEAGGVWGRQREREDPVVVGLGLAPRVGGSGSGIAGGWWDMPWGSWDMVQGRERGADSGRPGAAGGRQRQEVSGCAMPSVWVRVGGGVVSARRQCWWAWAWRRAWAVAAAVSQVLVGCWAMPWGM